MVIPFLYFFKIKMTGEKKKNNNCTLFSSEEKVPVLDVSVYIINRLNRYDVKGHFFVVYFVKLGLICE